MQYVSNPVPIQFRGIQKQHYVTINDYPESFPSNQCEVSKTDFRAAGGLYAIVTGTEHSGTTVMSQLIMSAPKVYGGVECGMLLASEPSQFDQVVPFYEWMLVNKSSWWDISNDQRASLLESSCFAEMYTRLRQYSPLYQHPVNTKSWVIDKTPRYIRHLVAVMDKTPGVPVVVTLKSRENQLNSFLKRGKNRKTKEEWLEIIEEGRESLMNAMVKYPDRMHVVNATLLYQDPNAVMEKVFKFLKLEGGWKPEYLTMEAANAKQLPGYPDPWHTLPFNPQAGSSKKLTARFRSETKKWKENRKKIAMMKKHKKKSRANNVSQNGMMA